MVLYMRDNQVVIKWINSRQAKHPFASYLLQILSAVEACYGFHLHTAYLRTYRNVVADALTRQDAAEVIRQAGLENLPKPDAALRRFLDRGWQKRAIIWAGQADADQAQAFRLAEARGKGKVPLQLAPTSALDLSLVVLGQLSEGYPAAFLSSGAELIEIPLGEGLSELEGPWRGSRPDDEEGHSAQKRLVCLTLPKGMSKGHFKKLKDQFLRGGVQLVWADSRDRTAAAAFGEELSSAGAYVQVKSICGRSLRDQVWWKRWVMVATMFPPHPFP